MHAHAVQTGQGCRKSGCPGSLYALFLSSCRSPGTSSSDCKATAWRNKSLFCTVDSARWASCDSHCSTELQGNSFTCLDRLCSWFLVARGAFCLPDCKAGALQLNAAVCTKRHLFCTVNSAGNQVSGSCCSTQLQGTGFTVWQVNLENMPMNLVQCTRSIAACHFRVKCCIAVCGKISGFVTYVTLG